MAALLGLPCIAVALGVVGTRWIEFKERQAALFADAGTVQRDAQAERIRALEGRVASLERIATDPAQRLSREIELLGRERMLEDSLRSRTAAPDVSNSSFSR
jgi:hypothetical protein